MPMSRCQSARPQDRALADRCTPSPRHWTRADHRSRRSELQRPAGVRQAWERAPEGPHSLSCMRAVQITRFGGPEVLDIVDVPEPEAGPGQQLYDVSTAGL